MKLVIDIPNWLYNAMMEHREPVYSQSLGDAVRDGTPLPKGHGRLKDIDSFITKVEADRKHSAYLRSWTADDVLNALDNNYTTTILEADKAESEDKA